MMALDSVGAQSHELKRLFPRSWTRHLNCTNAFSTLFIIYASYSMYTLYRIAVPRIPDLFTADGVRKRTLEPMWRAAPGLTLEVRLSTADHTNRMDEGNSVELLRLRDLPYEWNLTDAAELDLSLEIPESVECTVSKQVGWEEQVVETMQEEEVPEENGVQVDGTLAEVEGGGDGEGPRTASRRVNVTRTHTVRVPKVQVSTTLALDQAESVQDLADAILAAEKGTTRSGSSARVRKAPTGLSPECTSALTQGEMTVSSPTLNVTVKRSSIGGLRVRCAGAAGASVSPACRSLAVTWRTSHAKGNSSDSDGDGGEGSFSASAATAASSVVRKGLLPSLAGSIMRTLREEEDEESETARERSRGGLTVLESSSAGAKRVARALTEGRGVHAHSTVRWQDESQEAKGRFVRSPLPVNMRKATASATLVSAAPFQPAPRQRYLWTDFLPADSPLARAFARAAGIGMDAVYRSMIVQQVGNATTRKELRSAPRSSSRPASSAPMAATGPPSPAPGSLSPHWLGSLSLALVMQTESIPADEVPPEIRPFLIIDSTKTGYVPSLTANPVRPLRERFVPLNASVVGLADALPLKVRLSAVSAGTWRLMSVMDQSLTTQRSMGATERDTDDVIRLLAETPLWLLGLTFAVSFVHLLFDVLAFKNEVAFWAGAKSLKGISVRSLGQQLVSQLVISLYLFREGSSLLVMLPQGAGCLLLAWKMAKAAGLNLSIKYHVLPVLTYDAALAASATEGGSSRYDAEAVGAMTTLLYPLIVGYAAFTLIYSTHASWVDWALGTAVSAVYSMGFALMTPQLWINYRLRSVAHLPWRVLGYRFFNTVIDDLFAAIIRMPLLHRISVFRDDVIFLIYMVQRCAYPVDTSRPVEGFEDDDETRAASLPAPATAPSSLPESAPGGTSSSAHVQ